MVLGSGTSHTGEQAARAGSAGEDAYELAGQILARLRRAVTPSPWPSR